LLAVFKLGEEASEILRKVTGILDVNLSAF
jgi:hypothetical protein